MLANKTLLNMKYARVINEFSKLTGISLNKSLDIFYNSNLYNLMRNGVANIHCMSDKWLAEELKEEYFNKKYKKKKIDIKEIKF